MKTFPELEYQRPSLPALLRGTNACLKALKSAKTFAEADAALLRWHEIIYGAGTQYVLAQIRRDMNTKDPFYDREMKFYNTALPLLASTSSITLSTAEQSKKFRCGS